jgi:lipopolysaccharide export system protein LptA
MSPSTEQALLRLSGLALSVAAIAGGSWLVTQVTSADPLAEYRAGVGVDAGPGVEMTNFEWKVYDGGRLVARAQVGRATVGRDRNLVRLFAVSDGRYYAADSRELFMFRADEATYSHSLYRLLGRSKTYVSNSDMSIGAKEFDYDVKAGVLVVPGPVQGRLQGGDFKAGRVVLLVEDGLFKATQVKWAGMVAQDGQRRRWKFESLDSTPTQVKGDVTTFGKLRATDGEVIVVADSGEYNRKEDVLVAKGQVRYFGSDANVACDQVTVYRKERRAVLTGRVDMLIKPKGAAMPEETEIPPLEPLVPDDVAKARPPAPPPEDDRKRAQETLRSGRNIRDYPIAVTAHRIEYWYAKGQRRAVISGSPQARQELGVDGWRRVWAHEAFYDGETERLRLTSRQGRRDVRMINSLGDDLTALEIEVSTQEGVDDLTAKGLQGEMAIDEDELPPRPERRTGPPLTGPIGGV